MLPSHLCPCATNPSSWLVCSPKEVLLLSINISSYRFSHWDIRLRISFVNIAWLDYRCPARLAVRADVRMSTPSTFNTSSASPPLEDASLSKPGQEVSASRVRKTRTKTGCITCRIRRVKCDEAKPACVRCTSTGRKCDGYPTVEIINKSIVHRNPGFAGSPQELRGIFYFRKRTSAAFSGFFDSDFWTSHVLQASEAERTVRHALLALSYLHESLELSGDAPTLQNDTYHQSALQEYNKAVALTAHQISANTAEHTEVTLIVCVLFICVELMLNNFGNAINHLKYGLRILSMSSGQILPSLQRSSRDSRPPKRSLGQVFTRLITQSIYLGTPYHKGPILVPDLNETLKTFSTISEARESLDDLFIATYVFLRTVRDQTFSTDHQQPEKYTTLLQQWHTLFLDFINRQRPTFTPKDSSAATILQLHYISIYIILTTTLNSSVSALEALTPSFARIIALAETLLGPISRGTSLNTVASQSPSPAATPPMATLPKCTFDLGVIQPLYFTALRCRSSSLRWRAISLLRCAPLREGIWGAAMTARMAQRIVEIEEETGALLVNRPGEREGAVPVHEDKFIGLGAESSKFWEVRFTNPGLHERTIRMQIGKSKKDINAGKAREELITW